MENLTLSERLAALRKQAKLSQAEVAAKLSLSRQAVSKWESGKGLPSLIAYSVLSSLYGISVDMILSGKETAEDTTLPNTKGKSFSDALRTVRRHRKISQEEVATNLLVSRQSVSKWESGKAEPDADHLIALAELLKVSLTQLLPIADAKPSEPKEEPVKKVAAPQTVKVEKTKVTAPKVETPKVETPKVEAPKAPAPAPVKKPAPQPKPQAKPQVKPKHTPEPVSRRQLLQERVRLAGQKERAAKAALSKSGIKKKI